MAQLVEHHLAKVRVASSNLVIRSKKHQVSGPFGAADLRFGDDRRPLGARSVVRGLVRDLEDFDDRERTGVRVQRAAIGMGLDQRGDEFGCTEVQGVSTWNSHGIDVWQA